MSRSGKTFTAKQGQYLAYIHLYTQLHCRLRISVIVSGVPPAETDMREYFRVSPPSVHQMVAWARFCPDPNAPDVRNPPS